MYRIKLAAGTILEFDSIEALTAEIRTGVVDAEALIFHQRANQWLPIHVHPAWKQALAAIERSGHALPASARVGNGDTGAAGRTPPPATASAPASAAPAGGTATRPAARPVLRVPRPTAASTATPSATLGASTPKPAAAPTTRPPMPAGVGAAPTLADTLGLDLLELADTAAPTTTTSPTTVTADAAPAEAAPAANAPAPAPTRAADEPAAAAAPKRVEPDVSVDNLDEELELLAPDEVPAAPAAPPAAPSPTSVTPRSGQAAPSTAPKSAHAGPSAAPKSAKPASSRPPAKRAERPAGPAPSLIDASSAAPRSPMLEPQAVSSDAPAQAPTTRATPSAAPADSAPSQSAAEAERDEPIERSRAGEPSIVTTPSAPTRADAPMLSARSAHDVPAAIAPADAVSAPVPVDVPAPAPATIVAQADVPAAVAASVEVSSAEVMPAVIPSAAAAPTMQAMRQDDAPVGAATAPAAAPIAEASWSTASAPVRAENQADVTVAAEAASIASASDTVPFTAPRPATRRMPPAVLAAGIGVTVVGLAVAAFAMRDRGDTAQAAAVPEPKPVADAGVPTAPLVLPPESEPAAAADSGPALRIAPDDVPPALKSNAATPAPETAAPATRTAARTEPPAAPAASPAAPRDAAARRTNAAEEPEALVAAPTIGPIDVGANTVTLRTEIAPAVLASRYAAAHDAAWNDLVAKLRLAGFAQLFAPAKLAPGAAASTKVALAAARQHIGAWRSRAGVIEKAYRDSSAALQGGWSAAERAAWEARAKRAESGEDAQTASALLGAADRMYAVLAANAGGYQLVGGELRFTDTGAQREYWEARRAFLAALGGAGEGGVRLPVGAIVSAVGATRPPDGTIAN